MQIPGIHYVSININGPRFEKALVWQLSWLNILKLLYHLATSNNHLAIRLLTTNAMLPMGLTGLSHLTLSTSGPAIADFFHLLSSSSSPSLPPHLLHCTQGKDRTGILVLLFLLLLSPPGDPTIPTEAITHDYMLSTPGLLPERESRLQEIHDIGLTDSFADCPEDWVEKTVEEIEGVYGGVEKYLQKIGVGKAEQDVIRERYLMKKDGRGGEDGAG